MSILHNCTPSVTILDNRGLTVRTIAYHRHPGSPDITSERITHHHNDARGFLTQSADPRLSEAGLANFTWLMDLAGSVLRTVSADAGTTVALNDAAGRPFIEVSNIGTTYEGTEDRSQAMTRTWQYEDAKLPGRPVGVTEQATGEAARITERFVYATNTAAEKALNLAGACVCHYDTAGLTQTDSVALTGLPLSVTRRLLKDADNPYVTADWQGTDASAWNDLLAGEAYATLTTADATDAVLTTTDAKGNLQRVAYDVAGLLSGSWLTLKGGKEQVVVASLTYSAAGQKLREEHGNGVVTTYAYEPATQRLTGIKTERPTGHASGTKVLQDLRYEYDPVGNVLSIRNDAEKTRFWRNQEVAPENTYTYDSLYQLVSATGREMANAGQQGNRLPAAITPLPADSSSYTGYTRTYTYDSAGNLTQLRHSAPATNNNYTTNITVSDRSNRGVLSSLTELPSKVDALFTAGGQQKELQPGQNLIWTPRNELLKVTPVVRDSIADDRECYRYDADSQRLLKVSVQKTGNSTQMQRVLYLPGLELRTTKTGNAKTEDLQVITVGEAGRAQVRVLHWESGIPEDISNDQVRYSYDNLVGSSQLELDGAGNIITMEEYYPYGGTAVWAARSAAEANYKTIRYSGKERDATGLYYYDYRYYQPWLARWLSVDPAGTVDGLNLYQMVKNNPITNYDSDGQATLLGNAISGLGNIIENGVPMPSMPSMSMPSMPSMSMPSMPSMSMPSMPSMSMPSMPSLLSPLRFVAGKIYKYAYKAGVKRLFKYSKNNTERIRKSRLAKGIFIGGVIGAAVGGAIATAGLAIPVAIGAAAAASLIGGALGYFSGRIAAGFSRLLHKAPGPVSARAAAAGQFSNFINGGTTQSAVNTALIGGITDAGLNFLGRSSEIRITTGGEIGTAAGTDVALHGGTPGRATQYTAPIGVSLGSLGAESYTDMEDIGELSAVSAYEGSQIGRSIDRMLGFSGGNILRRLENRFVQSITGINLPSHPFEFAFSAIFAAGRAFLGIRTRATNNFQNFRDLSFD